MTQRESFRRFAWGKSARAAGTEFRPARAVSASRAALLFGTALGCSIAVFAASAPTKAFAADECGPNDPGADTNTCTPGAYPTIEYLGGDDLTVVLPGPSTVADGVVQTGTGSQTFTAQDGTTIYGVTDTAVIVSAFNSADPAIATVTVDDVSASAGLRAIDVDGYDAAFLTINGDVDSTAAFANTVEVTSQYGVVVVNNGSVSAFAGTGFDVISASSIQGSVNVFNGGSIYGAGTNQYGIDAYSGGGDVSDTVTVTNNGGVTMVGDGATAIAVTTNAGTAQVVNNGSISTDGDAAYGINVYADEGSILVTNNGDITTGAGVNGGVYAYGIRAVSDDGSVFVTNGEGGTINTYGAGADGVYANAGGTGDVSVTNAGFIATEGNGADGVYAYSFGGDVVIDNSATVTTSGDDAHGLYGWTGDASGGAATITNSGEVTTTGDGSIGIYAWSYNADATVTNSGVISTGDDLAGTGSVAHGVYAYSEDGDAIIVNTGEGQVATAGDSADALRAYSYSGNASVTNAGTVITAGDFAYGIYAYSYNGGTVTATNSGSISTGGDFAYGVYAYANGGGAVSVTNSGSVTTLGDDAVGLYGGGDTGTVTIVNSGAVSTAGEDAVGVLALTDGNILITNSGSVTTTGAGTFPYGSQGIVAISGAGTVTVNGGGDVTTSGLESTAVLVTGVGDVTVVQDDITTSGDYSDGVYATSSAGNVSVTTGDVVTNGDSSAGIAVVAAQDATVSFGSVTTNGDIVITVDDMGTPGDTTDDVTTYGPSSFGVAVFAGDDISITGGAVDTDGYGATGVGAVTYSGDVVINVGPVQTDGDDADGVFARAAGGYVSGSGFLEGNATITVAGVTTTGDSADGVDVLVGGGDATVTSTGPISTSGANSYGVRAVALSFTYVDDNGTPGDPTDDVTLYSPSDVVITVGSVTTTGLGSTAIYGSSQEGDVTITAGAITTSNARGIVATAGDDVVITRSGAMNTGAFAGITAMAGDDINVTNTGPITTTGVNAYGIHAMTATGDIVITNSGAITTSGAGAHAIYAEGGTGSVTITNTGALTTSGADAYGIQADTTTGAITINNGAAITTTGTDAKGIHADSDTGVILITNSGNITTSGGGGYAYGIHANSDGNVGVTNTGVITTSGVGAHGIYADSNQNNAFVVNNGTINTSGADAYGIYAWANNGVLTITSNVVNTTGAGSIGVYGWSGDGTTITSTNVTTTGANATGIYGRADTGAVVITSGTVNTSGAGADAIFGYAVTGPVTVTVNTRADSAQAAGVRTDAETTSTINVAAGAVVEGGTAGIQALSVTGTTITNAGTIRSSTAGNFALDVDGGAATITNSGTITGSIDLTDNADTTTNSGTSTAVGTSQFGGGADVFTNTGANAVVTVFGGTATFNDLETFNNNGGRIDMRDGAVNDIFDLSDATFNATGNSRLQIDVDLDSAGPGADLLRVGTAGTGSTTIEIADLTTGLALNFAGVRVVDAGTADGNEFVLGGTADQGFVYYNLSFDAATDDFFLQALPDSEVFQMLGVGAAAGDFWNRSGDAWSARMMEIRDSNWGGSPTRSEGSEWWMQGYGGGEEFTRSQTFTFGSFSTTENLSTESDYRGFQMGVDTLTGNFLWGVTAGFADQETEFADGNSFDLTGFNVGVYAGLMSGPFFVNGLVKGDFYEAEANFGTVPLLQDMDASSIGAKGEVGFRFGGQGLFLEPSASLAWVDSDVTGFDFDGASFDFGDNKSLLGKAGARIGGTFGSGSLQLTPYVGAYWVDELEGENDVTFTTTGDDITFVGDARESHGQAVFGFTAQSWYGLEGFLKGTANFGDETEGFSTRLGVRWRW